MSYQAGRGQFHNEKCAHYVCRKRTRAQKTHSIRQILNFCSQRSFFFFVETVILWVAISHRKSIIDQHHHEAIAVLKLTHTITRLQLIGPVLLVGRSNANHHAFLLLANSDFKLNLVYLLFPLPTLILKKM